MEPNYINMTLTAFLDEVLPVRAAHLTKYGVLEIQNYIRVNSNDFEKSALEAMKGEIEFYYYNYPIRFNDLDCENLNKQILRYVFQYIDEKKGKNINVGIPQELTTPAANELLNKATKAGLIGESYVWLGGTLALLAYFADRASEHLGLGKGEYNGKKKIAWKPFETLFRVQGLAGAKKDYQRTGSLPIGHEIIDRLFK